MPETEDLSEPRRLFFAKADELAAIIAELTALRDLAFPVGSTVALGRESAAISTHWDDDFKMMATLRGGFGSRTWSWNRNLLTDISRDAGNG